MEYFDKDKGAAYKVYLEVLRKMTPEQKLMRVFELNDFVRELFKTGVELRYPEKSEEELHEIFLERIDKCHNRNW